MSWHAGAAPAKEPGQLPLYRPANVMMSRVLSPMPPGMLIVDDEEGARYALLRVFASTFEVREAASVVAARAEIRRSMPAVILLDYQMPGADGLALLREIGLDQDGPAVIMITAHGSERVAVEAMKAGAWDYLVKPYDLEELRLIVARALERQQLRSEVIALRERLAQEGQFGRLVGNSEPMRRLFQQAERVAQTDLPVLLLGESGTGKDLLAQELHTRSPRASRRMVTVNCAAVPETLVESELFGYTRGAFTGAVSTRAGRFEAARGGTLFLDEIGDMTPSTQAKILRAAEAGVVERLGDNEPLAVDVRIVSATNQNLDAAIREGRFRQDLYYRLSGFTLQVPPLRERRSDIPLLVEHFWKTCRQKYDREGPKLSREILSRLENHEWPGNVRELRNTVERLFVMARGEVVELEDYAVALDARPGTTSATHGSSMASHHTVTDFREARTSFERDWLAQKLAEHSGNVTRTAAAIGLERQSLQEKIRKLGLSRQARD
jgi:DNA-binding NtrC family response regulator